MLQTFEPTRQHLYNAAPASTAAPTQRSKGTMAKQAPHHIWIVTGPAGSGKSTVAKYLADKFAFTYIEGDDFHPQANIEKMSTGIPLNDADRWDWLILLRDQALASLAQGAKGVVVTCSALKKKYRDVIRTARLYDNDPNAKVRFIYLHADPETLLKRVRARQGHYMKDSMVWSQINSLEPPDEYEVERLKDVIEVDVSGSMTEVQKLAADVIQASLSEDAASA